MVEKDRRVPIEGPFEYFKNFSNSPLSDDEIATRFKNAQKNDPTITIEEIREAYWNTDAAINKLWKFWSENHFKLDEGLLSQLFREGLTAYFDKIREISDKRKNGDYSGNRDEIQNDDIARSRLHTKAAEVLVEEGAVPNILLGRVLVHFMAVDKGLDQPDVDRIKRRRSITR